MVSQSCPYMSIILTHIGIKIIVTVYAHQHTVDATLIFITVEMMSQSCPYISITLIPVGINIIVTDYAHQRRCHSHLHYCGNGVAVMSLYVYHAHSCRYQNWTYLIIWTVEVGNTILVLSSSSSTSVLYKSILCLVMLLSVYHSDSY
jgi:hypothetical protein